MKKIIDKILLHGGIEQNVSLEGKIYLLFNKNVDIKYIFDNKDDFLSIYKYLNIKSVEKIITECDLKLGSFLPIYKNNEKMEVYFVIKDNFLIIVSEGETQPFLYKIYLEGVWELEEEDW